MFGFAGTERGGNGAIAVSHLYEIADKQIAQFEVGLVIIAPLLEPMIGFGFSLRRHDPDLKMPLWIAVHQSKKPV